MQKAFDAIKKYEMFKPGCVVGVAVSGGSDSMALLHFLNENKDKLDIEIIAIHVNHTTRVNDDRDQVFVEDYCKEHRIRFHKFKIEATRIARNRGLTMEEACREGRYGIFEGLRDRGIVDVVAIAHHQSDQAETILLHILRGSGLSGASGMNFVRDGFYVRPFLDTKKSEIMAYVYENDIPYVEDETNQMNLFSRNILRNKVLPELRLVWPNVDESLANFGLTCREDDGYIRKMMNFTGILRKERLVKIPLTYFVYDRSLVSRMLYDCLGDIGVHNDIEHKHIDLVINLVKNADTGARLDLPHEVTVYKEYEYLTIARKKPKLVVNTQWEFKRGVTKIEDFGKIRVKKGKLNETVLGGLLIDGDKVPSTAVWRMRKEGDVITKFGGGTKKLKAYLIDKKVPARMRDYTPVLADGSDILLVAGVDISEKLRVTQDTKHPLIVEYTTQNWE